MNSEIWKQAADWAEQGKAFCIIMIVESVGSVPRRAGCAMIVSKDGREVGTVGGGTVERQAVEEAQRAISNGKPHSRKYNLNDPDGEETGSVCGGNITLQFFPHAARFMLHIFGAGHVARPTADFAIRVGYSVIIYDEIDTVATQSNFPKVDTIRVGDCVQLASEIDPETNSAVLILTGSHDLDFKILRTFKDRLPPYLGVIASKKKAKLFRDKLREEGWNDADLESIHSPVGLSIGARTPEEIAISIVAELLATRGAIE